MAAACGNRAGAEFRTTATPSAETGLKEQDWRMSYFNERRAVTRQLPVELSSRAAFPPNALVELTNGCNHACIFCKNSHQGRRATYLSLEKFNRFVRQAAELGLQEVGLYSTGEPFMIKNLWEYVQAAKLAGIDRVYLTTNGALASLDKVKRCYEVGLDSIKFSINAANPTIYKLVHGYDDWHSVIKNVSDIYEWKTDNRISLQLLCSCVMIPSVGDIRDEYFKTFGKYFDDVNYVESGSQGGQAFELMDELAVSPHGVFNNFGAETSVEDLKPCSMVWNRVHLTAEGYLTACCVDYELDLVFSDLESESLADAWNNEVATRLRKAHLGRKLDGMLCNQCMRNKKLPYAPLSDVKKSIKTDELRGKEKALLKARIMAASRAPEDGKAGR